MGAGMLTAFAGCSGEAEPSSEGADGSTSGKPEPAADTTTTTAESTTANAETTESEEGSTAAESQSASIVLGETVEGDNLAMVAREVSRTTSLSEFQEAESGNEYVVVRLAVKNTSQEFIDFSSFWQTRLKDGENHVYDATFGATQYPFDSGTLAPGEVSRGDVVYEVPEGTEDLTLQFDFSTFDIFQFNRVTLDLSESADSTADLSQDLGVDVHSPGESASHSNISVTVHGVRTETELGEFTSAEEGNEYIIPDIEITNNTDEPLSVSTLLQMRVKTGSGLTFQSDLGGSSRLDQGYSEGSDIAAGESRRGELAFQVGQDMSPLYFVFDFYSFADAFKAFWELRG